ncbi:hypothetical protein [Streptomyces sp. NBC_00083]|uniref:hypothetical protein n=1 Tax=Streptomyces sp. NBC_00083 TaxID=2975647 RepID=UPI0022584C5F|nr:hypothetical protein [Streptomyces sp. NBC_00083]MCX5386974.1 hypothetical protein [Streptomyces sp. NBC_00083]
MLAVLAGTEQAALALQSDKAALAGELPRQGWGSAAGRGHEVSAEATTAQASGGNSGPLKAPGELPRDAAGTSVNSPLDVKPAQPAAGTAEPVKEPDNSPVPGFDEKTSKELVDEHAKQARTYFNADGISTTRFFDEPVNYQDGSQWKEVDTRLVHFGRSTRDVCVGPGVGAGRDEVADFFRRLCEQ